MEHTKNFLNLLLDRRSCRAFQPDALDRPTLAAIVETGRYAPSAMNIAKEPLLYHHRPDAADPADRTGEPQARGLLPGRDFRYGAPALVLVTNRKRPHHGPRRTPPAPWRT